MTITIEPQPSAGESNRLREGGHRRPCGGGLVDPVLIPAVCGPHQHRYRSCRNVGRRPPALNQNLSAACCWLLLLSCGSVRAGDFGGREGEGIRQRRGGLLDLYSRQVVVHHSSGNGRFWWFLPGRKHAADLEMLQAHGPRTHVA